MWSFLTWWFHDCEHGLIEIGWTVPGENRGIRHFKRFDLEDETLTTFAATLNRGGSNVYYRASTIAPDAPSGHTTDKFVMCIPGAWGDWDVMPTGSVVPMLLPCCRVITGRHPAIRMHGYLKYQFVLTDIERARQVNGGLARVWQSDTAVANPSRLMRLPGTISWPMKPGRIPEMTELSWPTDGRPRYYAVEFIEQQIRGAAASQPPPAGGESEAPGSEDEEWGPSPSGAGPQPSGGATQEPPGGAAISPEAELLRKIRAGQEWHNNVLRLVAHLVGVGMSDAMILALADGLTLPGWTSAQTRAEMQVMIEGARKRWMRSDPRPSVMQPPTEDDVEPIDIFASEDRAAPELLERHVPGVIFRYAKDTAGRLGIDPVAVALSALVVCASVISDRWKLQPKMHDTTWTECARLWAAIVGEPSILKSPTVSTTTAPLDQLEKQGRLEHQDKVKEFEERHAEWKKNGSQGDEPIKPRQPRYLVESTTKEALEDVLREDGALGLYAPADKLLCRSDELSEWVSNQDRYAGGKGSDRGAWLRAYNGGRFVVDRVGRGHFAVPNWSVCLLGGIQPEVIRKIATESTDDGVLQRFMYVVPDVMRRGEDRAPGQVAVEGYEGLIGALAHRFPRTGLTGRDSVVVIHADGHRHRHAIDDLVDVLRLQHDTSGRMKSALGKWSGLFARLTLTFHLIELASGSSQYPEVVAASTAEQVASFMREVLLPHLYRADAVMFSTPRTSDAQDIAELILAHRLERLTWRDITRNNKRARAPEAKQGLDMALLGLVALGWLEPEPSLPGRGVHAWTVNQRVHVVFAERAEAVQRMRAEVVAKMKAAKERKGRES